MPSTVFALSQSEHRSDRFVQTNGYDPRNPYQRDRDRVLYSPEFRRLSGVTQVASAGEGDVFHNRLTHSLKVAQVGRRLAERLLKDCKDDADAWGGLDPDVVETAALAHDLGHPPFGHDGEEKIREFVEGSDGDGFEGNPQSFRIVTRLAAHTDNRTDRDDGGNPDEEAGLNLTRASLNAILKYPWLRADSGKQHRKWGAYVVDSDRFAWARDGWDDELPSLEAELMNWADDVTYAVHDLEDFFRAGLIPIHRLQSPAEQARFTGAAVEQDSELGKGADLEKVLEAVLGNLALLDRPYDGGWRQRTIMNSASSSLITQFITGRAIRILSPPSDKTVEIDPEIRKQVELLQAVTKYYVINHPRLVGVREGQREMLAKLAEVYAEALTGERNKALVPEGTRDRFKNGEGVGRLVADLLTTMTERQVVQNYQRLMGIVPSPAAYFDV